MEQTLIVRGRYVGRTFIPDGPLPDEEGTAELIITPTSPRRARGSVADAFGTAPVRRSGDDILVQMRADRDKWGAPDQRGHDSLIRDHPGNRGRTKHPT